MIWVNAVNTTYGDDMKGSKDLLSSVLKTTQMGQVGIRCVLKFPLNASLRTELRTQLRQYDEIEQEAHSIASSRGWTLEELDPAVKVMAGMMTRTRLKFGNADSKTAAMMIQGNTRGMILGLKNLRKASKADPRALELAQRLLNLENMNIQKSQQFL